jgi:lipopolysaccharide/colanic/teichoic acid biosynthesis glycosyltransferase
MTGIIELSSNAGSTTDAADISPWNHSKGKRAFDLLLALLALTLTFPALVIAALATAVSSRGPIIYRQWRCGKDGKQFQLLKIRTMVNGPAQAAPSVTRAGDPRITRVGSWLRRWKLDELPQFFNVLRGDMSLVGPRPDVPKYLASLNRSKSLVLCLSPGLTGAATLRYRNEEQLLAQVPSDELEAFYCNKVLPDKVEIDLSYARNAGFVSDLAILLRTASAVFH